MESTADDTVLFLQVVYGEENTIGTLDLETLEEQLKVRKTFWKSMNTQGGQFRGTLIESKAEITKCDDITLIDLTRKIFVRWNVS